eukprot:TCONS_00003138-protein
MTLDNDIMGSMDVSIKMVSKHDLDFNERHQNSVPKYEEAIIKKGQIEAVIEEAFEPRNTGDKESTKDPIDTVQYALNVASKVNQQILELGTVKEKREKLVQKFEEALQKKKEENIFVKPVDKLKITAGKPMDFDDALETEMRQKTKDFNNKLDKIEGQWTRKIEMLENKAKEALDKKFYVEQNLNTVLLKMNLMEFESSKNQEIITALRVENAKLKTENDDLKLKLVVKSQEKEAQDVTKAKHETAEVIESSGSGSDQIETRLPNQSLLDTAKAEQKTVPNTNVRFSIPDESPCKRLETRVGRPMKKVDQKDREANAWKRDSSNKTASKPKADKKGRKQTNAKLQIDKYKKISNKTVDQSKYGQNKPKQEGTKVISQKEVRTASATLNKKCDLKCKNTTFKESAVLQRDVRFSEPKKSQDFRNGSMTLTSIFIKDGIKQIKTQVPTVKKPQVQCDAKPANKTIQEQSKQAKKLAVFKYNKNPKKPIKKFANGHHFESKECWD